MPTFSGSLFQSLTTRISSDLFPNSAVRICLAVFSRCLLAFYSLSSSIGYHGDPYLGRSLNYLEGFYEVTCFPTSFTGLHRIPPAPAYISRSLAVQKIMQNTLNPFQCFFVTYQVRSPCLDIIPQVLPGKCLKQRQLNLGPPRSYDTLKLVWGTI